MQNGDLSFGLAILGYVSLSVVLGAASRRARPVLAVLLFLTMVLAVVLASVWDQMSQRTSRLPWRILSRPCFGPGGSGLLCSACHLDVAALGLGTPRREQRRAMAPDRSRIEPRTDTRLVQWRPGEAGGPPNDEMQLTSGGSGAHYVRATSLSAACS